MTIGERIKKLREQIGLTQDELASRVGFKHKSSINKIETGERKLMQDKILAFANALETTPEAIMGWDDPAPVVVQQEYSDWEKEHIKKYRMLDQRGKDVVDYILNEECYRCHQFDNLVPMPDAGFRAAAGRWVYDPDVPTEIIMVKPKEGADFVIGVSGDSMDPEYCDGDKVYIKRTTDLNFGDVGLFQIGDEYYVKELGPDGLHSRNPKYSVIPKSADIIVVGKVLGKVEEKKRWRPEKK